MNMNRCAVSDFTDMRQAMAMRLEPDSYIPPYHRFGVMTGAMRHEFVDELAGRPVLLAAARLRERTIIISSIDAASPHRRRMAQIMKTDEAANPMPAGFLRAAGCSGELE
jgi:hypothetical protein